MFISMANTLDELREALSEFDGRALTVVSEAQAKLSSQEGYLDCLIVLSGESGKGISDGATWLLKSFLENGGRLSEDQTSQWISRIDALDGWAAQLHFCQSVQHLVVSSGDAKRLVCWLQPLLSHTRPFLRAWSVDALSRISIQHSEFSDVAYKAVMAAADDPAASVRARVRNLGTKA